MVALKAINNGSNWTAFPYKEMIELIVEYLQDKVFLPLGQLFGGLWGRQNILFLEHALAHHFLRGVDGKFRIETSA